MVYIIVYRDSIWCVSDCMTLLRKNGKQLSVEVRCHWFLSDRQLALVNTTSRRRLKFKIVNDIHSRDEVRIVGRSRWWYITENKRIRMCQLEITLHTAENKPLDFRRRIPWPLRPPAALRDRLGTNPAIYRAVLTYHGSLLVLGLGETQEVSHNWCTSLRARGAFRRGLRGRKGGRNFTESHVEPPASASGTAREFRKSRPLFERWVECCEARSMCVYFLRWSVGRGVERLRVWNPFRCVDRTAPRAPFFHLFKSLRLLFGKSAAERSFGASSGYRRRFRHVGTLRWVRTRAVR